MSGHHLKLFLTFRCILWFRFPSLFLCCVFHEDDKKTLTFMMKNVQNYFSRCSKSLMCNWVFSKTCVLKLELNSIECFPTSRKTTVQHSVSNLRHDLTPYVCKIWEEASRRGEAKITFSGKVWPGQLVYLHTRLCYQQDAWRQGPECLLVRTLHGLCNVI